MNTEKFQKLKERLDQLDPQFQGVEELVEHLILQTLDLLSDSRLILENSFWAKNRENPEISARLISETLGISGSLQDQIYKTGRTYHNHFWETNRMYQKYESTKGAAKHFETVASCQEGEFCVLCGSTADLEVDHIVPVSRIGDAEDPNNMQLLCKRCNQAKSNLPNDFLPNVIKIVTTHEVSESGRIKFLLDTSVNDGQRNLGRCGCGTSARECKIEVVVRDHQLAANYLNLQTKCQKCC